MATQSREINQEQQQVVAQGNNGSRRFACQYCDRVFRSSQALGGHQNGHRRERAITRRARQEAQFASRVRNQPLPTLYRMPTVAPPAVMNPPPVRPTAVRAVPGTYGLYQYGRGGPLSQTLYLPSFQVPTPLVQSRYYSSTVGQRLHDWYVNRFSYALCPRNVGGAYDRWGRISWPRTPYARPMTAMPNYPRRVVAQQPTVTFADSSSANRMHNPSAEMNAASLQMNASNTHGIELNAAERAPVPPAMALPAPPSALALSLASPAAAQTLNLLDGACRCGEEEEIDLELRL